MKKIFIALVFALIGITKAMALQPLPQRILFAADSVNIAESQMERLGLVAEYIKNHPGENVIVGGFTSNKTPEAKIDALTTQRANNVRNMLIKNYGIAESRLTSIGVGVSTKYDDTTFNEYVSFFIP